MASWCCDASYIKRSEELATSRAGRPREADVGRPPCSLHDEDLPMRDFLQDVRYGVRVLGKNPLVTILIIVTLGCGIGANSAVFSIIYGVLMRPLPFQSPAELV